MTSIDAFERLAGTASLPPRVDIVQCDLGWLEDPEMRSVRARLDRRLYRAFIERRDAAVVRRVVLYDLPSAAGLTPENHGRLVQEHDAWIAGLVRDLENVDATAATRRTFGAPPSSYELRQIVIGREGDPLDLPADGVGTGEGDSWTREFERFWSSPDRTIENNLTGDVLTTGPLGDRDPTWHVWRT